MRTPSITLAVSLIICTSPVLAATGNVNFYGIMSMEAGLPSYATVSIAADIGTNFFNPDPSYIPLLDVSSISGVAAQIAGTGYTASASTSLGGNHAYASASAIPSTVLGAGGFSGWYDQVTINGGVGTGTAQFTVQLNGTVDVGALAGGLAYTLGTSSVHPSELTSSLYTFNTLAAPLSWPMDATNPIATYLLGASPYNDTSVLFGSTPTSPTGGIPSIPALSDPLGGDLGMGFPTYDLVLTPGAGQLVNITLQGSLNFTYGESFYLLSGLGVSVVGDGLEPSCTFDIGDTPCTISKDGTGATTFDFSNSANLVGIVLPEGAAASFASGNDYNVTAVPEPSEWLMMLAGLGLVGWRARHRS
ncbi:MAG: PEP-CTERM sorting domain-containing protein [Sulfuriferula multivorans]|uniref:PEP-CTERM sorting domain-containing protein n=1 Tax=Sulfuriferula multivorans TaxID=1559896 RepID=A0A7C9JWV0_9PROT|nr:PEP-CTERM sorting domain-containing protein [Sulfuriferula multivorans]